MKKVGLLRLISIAICMVFLAISCGQIHCPAFPEDETAWFPYSMDKMLSLTNGQDTIELQITDFGISESYSFSKNCDCLCEATLWFKTNIDTANKMSIQSSITFYKDDMIKFYLPLIWT